MNIQLIRNATIKLQYAGSTYLIDPYLASKNTQPSFAGKSANPTVNLPFPVSEILSGVDYVLVSHLHPDHFDAEAQKALPRDMPLICQPEDEKTIRKSGFINVEAVKENCGVGETTISRVSGQHGTGKILKFMGPVSGFIFQHPGEKTIYWMGDTILNEEVKGTIRQFSPKVIVCHAGGNRFLKEYDIFSASLEEDTDSVIMDKEQVVHLCQFSPDAVVIATHLESLDHETVTREELRRFAGSQGISDKQLLIPSDGMSVNLQ